MDTRVTSDGLRRDREWHPKVPEHGVNTSFSGSSEVSEQDNPHDEKGGIGAVPMIWMRGGVDFCQLCDSWEIPPTTMALPLSRCRSHVDMQTGRQAVLIPECRRLRGSLECLISIKRTRTRH